MPRLNAEPLAGSVKRTPTRRSAARTTGRISRPQIIGAVVVTLGCVVLSRVAYFQFGDDATVLATERLAALPAERGDLLDRTGMPLAINDSVADVYIDASGASTGLASWGASDQRKLKNSLAVVRSITGLSEADFAAKLAEDSHWVLLAKGLSASDGRRIRDLAQALVSVVERPQRVYPEGASTRGIVGSVQPSQNRVTTADGDRIALDDITGRTGLEKLLDDQLTGTPGALLTERGPGGREIPSAKRRLVAAQKGKSFALSLDRSLQFRTEEELRRALLTTGSISGYIGVMDVETGDLLASVGMEVDEKSGEIVSKGYNVGVIDTYEPGSTMKPFTMAAALESGTITPESRFNIEDHLIMRFKHEQKRFKDDVPHKAQYWSMRDILVNSSNVGTITIARKLGPEAVNKNLQQFGFGARTGLADPKVESTGIMRPVAEWSGVDIGTVPIGQGIAVSPVQMLAAMNTLAADGTYVAPRFVTSSIAADGTKTDIPPSKRRVVSTQTASEMRSVLADVVAQGTGKRAAVPGYEVAGKTGTAQKPEKGHYSENAYVASFAGFYPASAPRLSMLVMLDEPFEEYGGLTAAPVFSEMVRITAQRYRIAPISSTATKADAAQVLVTPELRAVNDPKRKAVAPQRPTTIVGSSSDTGTTAGTSRAAGTSGDAETSGDAGTSGATRAAKASQATDSVEPSAETSSKKSATVRVSSTAAKTDDTPAAKSPTTNAVKSKSTTVTKSASTTVVDARSTAGAAQKPRAAASPARPTSSGTSAVTSSGTSAGTPAGPSSSAGVGVAGGPVVQVDQVEQ